MLHYWFAPRLCRRVDRRRPRRRLAIEILEARTVPAVYFLSSGTGDGAVTLGVDGFGAFGSSVGADADDAMYDPIGPTAEAGTVFESGVAIRFGTTGTRDFLTSGDIGGSGSFTNPTVAGGATFGVSDFTYGVLSFHLVQTVAPAFTGAVQSGSMLTQTYTITNTSASVSNFELLRYMDGWIRFDGSLIDGGGRLAGPPEMLFETDSGASGSTLTTLVGTTATGGTTISSNRFTVDYWSTVRSHVVDGDALDDTVNGDGDADGFVDTPYDLGRASRNVFSVAAGATTTYRTQTLFGSGTPTAALVGVTVTQSSGITNVTEGGATDTYTVVLNSAPTANVIITVSPNSQLSVAPTRLTFTTINWDTPQAVTVTAVDDIGIEGTHLGTINHTAASTDSRYNNIGIARITASITDNDSVTQPGIVITDTGGSTDVTEGGATDTYTVALRTAPTANVVVNLNPGTQAGVSPNRLTFTPGNWSTPQTVTVSAVDDAILEGSHQGVINHTNSTSDSRYASVSAALTVGITDNDSAAVLIAPTAPLSIVEGGFSTSSRTYTAVLNGMPSDVVTINLTPNAELRYSTSMLTFNASNWNIPQQVSVSVVDNTFADGDRTTSIAHTITTSDSAFAAASVPDVTVNIIDDDNRLIVAGTENADRINILFGATQIQVVRNGKAFIYPTTFTEVLIIAGAGNDTVGLTNPTIPVLVLAGNGIDKVLTDGQSSANTVSVDGAVLSLNGRNLSLFDAENVIVNGKGAADTVTVVNLPTYPLTFTGGGGADRITGPDAATTWKITASDSGNLGGMVWWTSIEHMTGGADDDSFVFGTGKLVSGQVDGGAGSNTLDFAAYKTPIVANLQPAMPTVTGTRGFMNIGTIVGGSGSDKLIGAHQSNTWNVTSANTGDVGGLAFRSFENLTGGAMDDTFLLAAGQSIKGKVDGGGGSDVLDFTAFATNVAINLQYKTATGTGGFLNLEQFRGGSGTDTLLAANRINMWAFSGIGAGAVTGTQFDGFENLTGGLQADTFDMSTAGAWLGMLDGAGGSDTLIAAPGGQYQTTGINAGTLDSQAFRSVEFRR